MTPLEKEIGEAGNDLDLTILHMRVVQELISKAVDLRVGEPVQRYVLDEICTTIDCLEMYLDRAEKEHDRLWDAARAALKLTSSKPVEASDEG